MNTLYDLTFDELVERHKQLQELYSKTLEMNRQQGNKIANLESELEYTYKRIDKLVSESE